MNASANPLWELEKQAAEEGRSYGRERLRERLQQIADRQGSVSPRSGQRLQDACFRNFYHASQHLWTVAYDLYPQPEAARAWVEPVLHQLRHGQEAEVLAPLEALPEQVRTFGGVVSKLIEREIKYFDTHRDHIHYQNNEAKGFPIGSGAVESACSQFEDRFQRTGQFWKSQSLGRLQSLKVARQDGDWEELCTPCSSATVPSRAPES